MPYALTVEQGENTVQLSDGKGKHVCGRKLTKVADGRSFCTKCLQAGWPMVADN